MKIAIVILNWNGVHYLKQFIPNLLQNSKGYHVYVIDNASTDQSVEFLKTNYPTIKVVELQINKGYAGGYNEGLQTIEADVFCLLNSDVEVTKNWVSPIKNLFQSNSNIGIIQPKILDYNRQDYFEYAGAAGGFIDALGYPYCRGRLFDSIEKDTGQYDESQEVFWASGACFFIRSKVFHQLGGFDDSFFAHMEEIDLCWRAQNQGQKIYCVGQSKIYHIGGGTLDANQPQKTHLNFRNSLFCLVKNTKSTPWVLTFCRMVLDGIAGLRFLLHFQPLHTLAIIKAHVDFYRSLPQLIRFRKTNPSTIKHYSIRSVVWVYYVQRLRKFNKL